jgi:hypothetical protein
MRNRILPILVVVAVVLYAAARQNEPAWSEGEISDVVRARGLTFDSGVSAGDRAWIEAAIAGARPEAQRLIGEIDGLTTVRTDLRGGQAIGIAMLNQGEAVVSFDITMLNRDRALDRDAVVLHELGHVVDFFLADDELVAELDTTIPVPAGGTCAGTTVPIGPCTAVEERFADTFAKWALRGRISLAGSGYGIPAPASIEDWGAPLGRLAAELNAR